MAPKVAIIEKFNTPDFLINLNPSSLLEESVQLKSILLEEIATPFKLPGDFITFDGEITFRSVFFTTENKNNQTYYY